MDIFKNKVVVITGAASGIGLGIAKRISELGGIVVLLDINKPRLQDAQKELNSTNSLVLVVDVTDYLRLSAALNSVVSQYGRIDFLFNNAGIGGTLPIEDATIDSWRKIVDLNLMSVVNGTMAVLSIMKSQKGGHILNTSSIAGLIPFPGQTLYNTTKFAVTGMSLTLEPELRKHNIRISVICPGMVRTRIFYKPIIGAEASERDVMIPKEAIPVELAVEDILQGIRKRKRIIITPGSLWPRYFRYRLFGWV